MPRHAHDPRQLDELRRDVAGAAEELPKVGRPRDVANVTLWLPRADGLAIRAEAKLRGVSVTVLVAEWIEPRLAELRAAERKAA